MDQAWLEVLLAALQLIALLVVPGLIVCLALRPGWLVTSAAVVPLSVATIVFSAVATGFLGPWWGILAVAAGTAVMALIVWLLGRFGISSVDEKWRGPWWLVPVGTALTATVGIYRSVQAMGAGDQPSQSYDSLFHFNLIWSIGQRADASPLHVNLDRPESPVGFYPSAWHAWVSLVQDVGIPQATNAAALVLAWIIAPVGIALLVGAVSKSWTAAGVGALFTGVLGQFPLLLTWFGVLYPTLLAYALLPFFLTLLVLGLLGERIKWAPLVLAGLSLPGLMIAQPNAVFGLFYLSIPLVFLAVWRRAKWWALLVVPAMLAIDAATNVVGSIRAMRLAVPEWAPGELADSITRVALFTAAGPGPGVGIGGAVRVVLIVVGVIAAFRIRQARWLPFSLFITQMLHFVAFTDVGPLRGYFTGVWYGDSMRLGALMGVMGTVLIGLGIWQLALWLAVLTKWLLGKLRMKKTSGVQVAVAVTVIACLFAGSQVGNPLAYGYASLAGAFHLRSSEDGSGGGLVTEDGIALLERLDQNVPEDAVIINNPWTGSALAQMYSDRAVLFPQLGVGPTAEAWFLAENMRNALYDPEVCEVAEELGVRYVLDMGPGALWGGKDSQKRYLDFPGLYALDRIGVADVIDQEGNAKLMKITACG